MFIPCQREGQRRTRDQREGEKSCDCGCGCDLRPWICCCCDFGFGFDCDFDCDPSWNPLSGSCHHGRGTENDCGFFRCGSTLIASEKWIEIEIGNEIGNEKWIENESEKCSIVCIVDACEEENEIDHGRAFCFVLFQFSGEVVSKQERKKEGWKQTSSWTRMRRPSKLVSSR